MLSIWNLRVFANHRSLARQPKENRKNSKPKWGKWRIRIERHWLCQWLSRENESIKKKEERTQKKTISLNNRCSAEQFKNLGKYVIQFEDTYQQSTVLYILTILTVFFCSKVYWIGHINETYIDMVQCKKFQSCSFIRLLSSTINWIECDIVLEMSKE